MRIHFRIYIMILLKKYFSINNTHKKIKTDIYEEKKTNGNQTNEHSAEYFLFFFLDIIIIICIEGKLYEEKKNYWASKLLIKYNLHCNIFCLRTARVLKVFVFF